MRSSFQMRDLAVLALALLMSAGASTAAPRVASQDAARHYPAGQQPLVLAQMADPRIAGLEEEVRRLNGLMEELNFQILQMQDQIRRMQEDTEFRFQELEGNTSRGNGASEQRSENQVPPAGSGQSTIASAQDAQAGAALPGVETAQRGEPPRTLGTITFDEQGNVVTTGTGQPIDLLQQGAVPGSDNSTVAALPPSDNPQEIYRNSYEFILSGDYRMAESGFRQYLEQFPEAENVADANFWLGEALLGQERYREAAEVFLQANRSYPDAQKAPDMLLKLGVSLAAMNQRDVACATYKEIGHRYPNTSSVLQNRVKQEQALAGC
ncbi:tol-pal system protein YbgF [Chelativorans sp. Marseille-P2723]|uniref:tol-pal system protein YbgF n=1 Tax=Chelativorans sp. Marseille-P2723 TaxID=2709133 RepID=UPI00156F00F0|nr:tol-pal system protein YbgF [Chelativorans sp. Marseille-P2723]